jgi:biotin transport system substrate-specific component
MAKETSASMTLRMAVCAALSTALIIIGSYIRVPIPVGPVPIVLSDFFVMVTARFLGDKWGAIGGVLYLVLGAIGFPVFAGGKAGLAVLSGPTGGFLVGYIFAVLSIGLLTEKIKTSSGKITLAKNILALIVGDAFLFLLGIPWLKVSASMSWSAALAAGFLPFKAGIAIKITVAAVLGQVLLPRFKQAIAPAQRSKIAASSKGNL